MSLPRNVRYNVPEGTPTQVAHPNRATLRTVVVVAATTLLLLVAIAPDVIAAILDEPAITGELRAILAAASAALAGVAAALQRIALIPGVNAAIGLRVFRNATVAASTQRPRCLGWWPRPRRRP